MTKIFFVFFSLIASTGFAAGLSVRPSGANGAFANGDIYLIPSDTQSCYMKTSSEPTKTNDVSAKYFQVRNFSISWPDPDADVFISSIQATLQGGGFGSSRAPIIMSSNEIMSLNGTHAQWSAEIPRATLGADGKTVIPSVFTSACAMTFGGISIPAGQDVDFQATAQIEIIGVRRDSQGNEQPISAMMPVTINNMGLNNPPAHP